MYNAGMALYTSPVTKVYDKTIEHITYYMYNAGMALDASNVTKVYDKTSYNTGLSLQASLLTKVYDKTTNHVIMQGCQHWASWDPNLGPFQMQNSIFFLILNDGQSEFLIS